MKMSEGFSLPVYCVYDKNKVPFQINDRYGDLIIDGESTCDETNYELIAHAINNYDHLTQENQQLREALAALVETSSMNEAQLSQELLEFHEDSEALTKAINLLSQLEAKDA